MSGLDANERDTLFAENPARTLWLVIYLVAGIALMATDHRSGALERLRAFGALLAEPVYRLAALPGQVVGAGRVAVTERLQLASENERLRSELTLARTRLNRLAAIQTENEQMRALLGVQDQAGLRALMVTIIDVDLDPFRHRVLINRGLLSGLKPAQPVLDADGVVGQVIHVHPHSAQVLLISDPDHALPVRVARNGLRGILFGQGRYDRLNLPNIHLTADIEIGDLIETSGLGGGFPAGMPVGRVESLVREPGANFLVAEVRPSALLDRSRQLLVLWDDQSLDEAEVAGEAPPAAASEAVPETPEETAP